LTPGPEFNTLFSTGTKTTTIFITKTRNLSIEIPVVLALPDSFPVLSDNEVFSVTAVTSFPG
jgi:hypothetical protein